LFSDVVFVAFNCLLISGLILSDACDAK
jgi:hypothetical protein